MAACGLKLLPATTRGQRRSQVPEAKPRGRRGRFSLLQSVRRGESSRGVQPRSLKSAVRATGRRAVVAGAPISTYGIEAPAARAHGTCFGRCVGVGFDLLKPCGEPHALSLQCRFLATTCMEAQRRAQAFRRADFFCTLHQSPFGSVPFLPSPFFRPFSQGG